jgi:hypothetical protein
MNAQDIVTISAAVVALTSLLKWAIIPDRYGPASVLLLALVGVALWGFSAQIAFERSQLFGYFSGWIAVATSASGVYGFTRASGEALTRMTPPPGGAGSNPTVKG